MITTHTVTTNCYTIQLTTNSLLLTDAGTNEVLHSIPLDCIKHYKLLGKDNELYIQIDKYVINSIWCSIASVRCRCDTIKGCELVMECENAQQLLVLMEKTISESHNNGMVQYLHVLMHIAIV